jgi:hypothetical protein
MRTLIVAFVALLAIPVAPAAIRQKPGPHPDGGVA